MNVDMNRVIAYAKTITSKFFNPGDPWYDDALGDSLLTATQAILSFKEDNENNASLYTYIYKSIQYTMYSNYARKKYQDNINTIAISRDSYIDDFDIELCVCNPDIEEHVTKTQQLYDINQLINDMSKVDKNNMLVDVYKRLYIEGQSLTDIGLDLGLTPERIRQYKEKLLVIIRQHFKNKGDL